VLATNAGTPAAQRQAVSRRSDARSGRSDRGCLLHGTVCDTRVGCLARWWSWTRTCSSPRSALAGARRFVSWNDSGQMRTRSSSRFRWCWSTRTPCSSAGALAAEQITDVVDYVCRVGRRQQIFYLWRPLLRDPNDDMIAEVAVAGRAEPWLPQPQGLHGAPAVRCSRCESAGVLADDRRKTVSALSLRLPASIHRRLGEVAEKEGVSINQLINSALLRRCPRS